MTACADSENEPFLHVAKKKELNKQTKSISHCLHLTEVKAGC